jgi:hypothetical protein
MAAKKKSAVRRTDSDRLRTLVAASIHGDRYYTQKDLAALLGTSVRTLRRFKNEPGYAERMSARTWGKIREPLVREEKKMRTYIRRKFKVPDTPVVQFPAAHDLRTGDRSLTFDVKDWVTSDKINLLLGYKKQGGFDHWNLTVRLPKGMVYARAGRLGGGTLRVVPEDEDDEEKSESETNHYSTRPELFSMSSSELASTVGYHDDSGRKIVTIYVFQYGKKVKRSKRKGKKS